MDVDVEEAVRRLKGWVKLGAWLVVGLLVAYVGLKLAVGLLSMVLPALFVGGLAYLGYRWWRTRLAPGARDEDGEWDWELERERRRRW